MASLEEERRLAYVAITRARRSCFILHAANRRIYGQWTSSIPSRFVAELPEAHIEQETTMSGGESLWRANWSERADPFADVGPRHRPRPGLAPRRGDRRLRAHPAAGARGRAPARSASAIPAAATSRSASASSTPSSATAWSREIEGNKLEIDFEHAGRKRVLDSFVALA